MTDEDNQTLVPQTQGASSISLSGENAPSIMSAGAITTWPLQVKSSDSGKKKVVLRVKIGLEEGAPEWEIKLTDATGTSLWESQAAGAPQAEFNLDGPRPKDIKLIVEAPKGARYNDKVTIMLEVCLGDQVCATKEFSATARQSILVLKTSIGHERNVADGVSSKAKTGNTGIFAILAPGKLDGYVFMEAMNTDLVRETVRGVRKAKGLVEGETSFNEIEHFLTPKPLVSGIMEGDVVELVAGPFKGEKARVQKIDESKEEITVELFEATVPIPVTVRGDHVRVLEKEK
ncbi:MAG: transcription elongation factor Spt5 [Methanomassiliicoccales archaeon]|jgi:transcriptional antiterminator NusG